MTPLSKQLQVGLVARLFFMMTSGACLYVAVTMATVINTDLLSTPVLMITLFGIVFWVLTSVIHLVIVFVG